VKGESIPGGWWSWTRYLKASRVGLKYLQAGGVGLKCLQDGGGVPNTWRLVNVDTIT